MNKILLLALSLMLTLSTFSQDKKTKMRNRLDDVMEEEENNQLTLRFFNALTGDPVPNAGVTVFDEEYATDEEGKVRFPNPGDDGFVTVHFECKGYITSDFEMEIIAETFFFNRISVSPVLDLKNVRIVLDWEEKPADLDAHFIKENSYHISYHNTRVLADGTGRLDRDDMDGYGPETITIKDIDDNASYTYIVHDYTNRNNDGSKALSQSKATVKVYAEGRLMDVYQISPGTRGNEWPVFKIENGTFVKYE